MRSAPKIQQIPATRLGCIRRKSLSIAVFALLLCAKNRAGHGQSLAEASNAGHGHDSAEWIDIARHLPDPATASSAHLEMTADVLRARRFHADALTFYNAALNRGADRRTIVKKMGITCLELGQPTVARMFFARAVRLDKRDAVAWNDLAAADLALGNPHAAVGEYRHALKIDRTNAVFHANLALAYFEIRSPEDARRELEKALRFDPEVLHHGNNGGFSAQVLSSEHYGDICFQMAHLSAQSGDVPLLLEWLSKASERGLNLRAAMDADPVLRRWLTDARVLVLLQNHQRLNASNHINSAVPSLGAAPIPQPIPQ